jgi:quinol monooxygenase YgiN
VVVMDAKMKVYPRNRQEFIRTLETLKGTIPTECGLLGFCLAQDKEDEDLLRLTWEWQNQEGLNQYLASSQHEVFLGALQVLSEHPEIAFHTILDNGHYQG